MDIIGPFTRSKHGNLQVDTRQETDVTVAQHLQTLYELYLTHANTVTIQYESDKAWSIQGGKLIKMGNH